MSRYARQTISTPGSYFFTLQDGAPLGSILNLQFHGTNSFNADLLVTNWAWRTFSGTVVASNWITYDSFTGADNQTIQLVDLCPFAALMLRVNSVVGSLNTTFGR